MPNTTGLILASTAAVDCQLNPALTRAMLRSLALGLMDTHLDGSRPAFPDDARGKCRRAGRLLPSRIVPSVTLGLAAVLDTDREHAHHAPCGYVARKPRAVVGYLERDAVIDAFLPPLPDRRAAGWHTPSTAMPPPPASSIDEIRRKVVKELVDLDVAFARRRLTRRQRVARGLRRRAARIRRFGR